MKKPEKLMNAGFLILIAVSLITALGFNMITTLISSYAVSFGTELTAVGLISGIFSITALFFRPVGGFLSDFLNKKRICVYTTFLLALVIVFYALSPTVSILLVMRVLHGALFGINGTANMALATEFIPDDHMGEGLGYYGLGQVLAQIVGPTIGIAIRDAFGYRALFFIIAASTLLAAVVLQTAFHYETVVGHSSEGRHSLSFSSLIAKECIFYSLIAGLFSMGNGIVNSFLVLLGESSKIAQISLFFSVNAIVLFVLRLLVGKVIDRANLLFIVNLSLLAGAGSMILIGKSGILVPILIAAAIKAFGNVGGQISLQSACVKRVDAARIGVATSTYYIGADIGQGLGPIWGGKVAEQFGYEGVFFCMAGFFLLGVICFTAYQLHLNRKTASETVIQ